MQRQADWERLKRLPDSCGPVGDQAIEAVTAQESTTARQHCITV